MKLSNKIYIYIFIITVLLFINISLYKSSTITVGDTILHKPFSYRLISIPSKTNNSNFELFKHYMGMKSYFEFKRGSLILLQFKHIFLDKDVGIMLGYREILSNLDMMVIKENMKNIIYEKKCMYEFIINNNNISSINGFYRDKNISFNIVGNSKDIILKLKDDICK